MKETKKTKAMEMTPADQTPVTNRNPTSLKYYILFLSWPVVLVHRFWNNRPVQELQLIPFDDVSQDIQWYIKDTGDMVSISLILLAFYFSVKSIREKIAVGSFLLISIIDIIHYWLYYKHNEYFIILEFIIVLVAALLMGFKFRNR